MSALPQISPGFHGNIEELRGRTDPEAIKAAAREFEALLAHEMIKAMREASESGTGGLGKDTYTALFDMELARIMADKGLGLKEILLKGLDRQAKGTVTESGSSQALPSNPSSASRAEGRSSSVGPESSAPGSDASPAMPVDGAVSSRFGMRKHPIYGDHRFHSGLDIAAPEGTEVYPYRSGRVVFSGEQPGYGNIVVIEHGDGSVSKYGHNRANLVKAGDSVDEDTVIAEVGSTGLATGPHLHFEVRRNGKALDPEKILARK
ncbi:MAG: peptidoglycan DD-metalloendopeptidase family protein [Nitrospirales bacterium]|nr:peptidoglycan DD-metalloendopeptidase family protein [Nitrospirales bacterium]